MQTLSIGAPWTSTIGQLSVLAFVCDPSIWVLDIIPIWVIFAFTWTLHVGSRKELAFKFVKWLVWLFLGYWMLWDMTWIAFSGLAQPGTFWALYGTEYFSIIVPDTPLWLFVVIAIIGFVLSFVELYTVKKNPKRLIPFVLYLFYVYLIGGIDQVIAVPLMWYYVNSAVFVPAIIIAFVMTGDRRVRGSARPSPAAVQLLAIVTALVISGFGYIVVELLLHWSDGAFGANSWQLWLVFGEIVPVWLVLIAINLARAKRPIIVRVAAKSFGFDYKQDGKRKHTSGWKAILTVAFACTLIDMTIQILANIGNLLFTISAFEKFMYYEVAAIGEESLFRVGVVTGVLAIFYVFKSMQKSWFPIIVAAVVSGMAWSLMHWWTYAEPASPDYNPVMMWVLLAVGTVNGLFYAKTRNPLVVLIPHMIINAFAAFFSLSMTLVVIPW